MIDSLGYDSLARMVVVDFMRILRQVWPLLLRCYGCIGSFHHRVVPVHRQQEDQIIELVLLATRDARGKIINHFTCAGWLHR